MILIFWTGSLHKIVNLDFHREMHLSPYYDYDKTLSYGWEKFRKENRRQ